MKWDVPKNPLAFQNQKIMMEMIALEFAQYSAMLMKVSVSDKLTTKDAEMLTHVSKEVKMKTEIFVLVHVLSNVSSMRYCVMGLRWKMDVPWQMYVTQKQKMITENIAPSTPLLIPAQSYAKKVRPFVQPMKAICSPSVSKSLTLFPSNSKTDTCILTGSLSCAKSKSD